jgi:integrase
MIVRRCSSAAGTRRQGVGRGEARTDHPHECRHTFASFAIAAGVAKALCEYMGRSSIQVTYDRYGHLMPGNEAEAAGLLDAYLQRSPVVAGE